MSRRRPCSLYQEGDRWQRQLAFAYTPYPSNQSSVISDVIACCPLLRFLIDTRDGKSDFASGKELRFSQWRVQAAVAPTSRRVGHSVA